LGRHTYDAIAAKLSGVHGAYRISQKVAYHSAGRESE